MKPHVSRLPAALLAVLLGLSLVCVQAAPAGEAPFSDVAPTAWYALCIQDTQNRDLMQGVAPDTFRPEGTLSRAMAATLLWRLAGTPQTGQPSAFLDVPRDAWYTQAVDWAGEAGVVTGLTPTTFGPNQPVSREQLATLFYRWAQAQGADLSLGVGETVFTYSGSPSAWAKEAVDWAASRYFLVEHPDPAIPGRLLFPQLSPGRMPRGERPPSFSPGSARPTWTKRRPASPRSQCRPTALDMVKISPSPPRASPRRRASGSSPWR